MATPIDLARARELSLTRSEEHSTLFELEGVGKLHAGGLFGGNEATLRIDGVSFECRSVGRLLRRYVAEDRSGTVEGTYRRRWLGGGGTLTWRGDEYLLRRGGIWASYLVLLRGGLELARIRATSNPMKPVEVTLGQDSVPAGPLLFTVYLVRRFDRQSTPYNPIPSSGCGGGCGGGGG